MAKIDVTELDIFYISYDEPNCEEHWADLLNKVPWAKRVHGVKGFDKAHKTAAEQSETDRSQSQMVITSLWMISLNKF